MFIISKLITAIILPPGSVIAVMLALIIFYYRKIFSNHRFFFSLYMVLFILFSLISIEPVSEMLMRPLENYHSNEITVSSNREPDLIVVLGGGSIVRKNGAVLQSKLSSVTRDRVLEGLIVQKEENLPLLFTGGNVLKGENAPGEAEAVLSIMQRMGIDREHYILEGQSRNTFENAMFSSRITERRNIILITSAFHMKRGILCFEKAGFQIVETRAVDSRIDDKKMTVFDFLPSMSSLQNSATALHEYIGLFYYKLLYRV